jgi:hypothetical protein
MIDSAKALSTTTQIYSNCLRLEPEAGFISIVSELSSWLEWKTGTCISAESMMRGIHELSLPDNGELLTELKDFGQKEMEGPLVFNATYTHDDLKVGGRRWITQMAVDKKAGEFEIECTVSLFVEDSQNIPKPPYPSRPRLVVNLVESCRPTSCTPGVFTRTLTQPSAQKFLQEVNDIRRTVPIIVITSNWVIEPALNVDRMREQLIGLAHVYQVSEETDSWNLAQTLGREFSCFGDAIRVIWPMAAWKTGQTSMLVLSKNREGKPRTADMMERAAVLEVFRRRNLS